MSRSNDDFSHLFSEEYLNELFLSRNESSIHSDDGNAIEKAPQNPYSNFNVEENYGILETDTPSAEPQTPQVIILDDRKDPNDSKAISKGRSFLAKHHAKSANAPAAPGVPTPPEFEKVTPTKIFIEILMFISNNMSIILGIIFVKSIFIRNAIKIILAVRNYYFIRNKSKLAAFFIVILIVFAIPISVEAVQDDPAPSPAKTEVTEFPAFKTTHSPISLVASGFSTGFGKIEYTNIFDEALFSRVTNPTIMSFGVPYAAVALENGNVKVISLDLATFQEGEEATLKTITPTIHSSTLPLSWLNYWYPELALYEDKASGIIGTLALDQSIADFKLDEQIPKDIHSEKICPRTAVVLEKNDSAAKLAFYCTCTGGVIRDSANEPHYDKEQGCLVIP